MSKIDKKIIGEMPCELKDMFLALWLIKINSMSRNGTFGVINACREIFNKIDNLEAASNLIDTIISLGYDCIPIKWIWHGIEEKGIFVPNIKKDILQEIANDFNQDVFIYACYGHLALYDSDGSMIFEGCDFKVTDIDKEVIAYRENRKNISLFKETRKIIKRIEYRLNNEILPYTERRHLEKTLKGYKKKLRGPKFRGL